MAEIKMAPLQWFRNQIEQLDADLVRQMLKAFTEFFMGFEADQQCGAEMGKRSQQRINYRNGYRQRRWDTRVGTIPLELPRLRKGSTFPDWLFALRRRAEKALFQVISESYVNGVSPRRVEHLAAAMGIETLFKSRVPEMVESLDALVDDFRQRPLDRDSYRYVWLDALTQRCREGGRGRVVNVVAVIVTALNADGRREILGLDVFTKSAQDFVAAPNRSIFAQPNATEVWARYHRFVDQLAQRFADAADLIEQAAFPKPHWRQIWSNNPRKRLDREI